MMPTFCRSGSWQLCRQWVCGAGTGVMRCMAADSDPGLLSCTLYCTAWCTRCEETDEVEIREVLRKKGELLVVNMKRFVDPWRKVVTQSTTRSILAAALVLL